jgi:hypothetical protein
MAKARNGLRYRFRPVNSPEAWCQRRSGSMEQDYKKEIEEFVGQKCPRDFKCYKLRVGISFPKKDNGSALFLECLEEDPVQCKFSMSFGYSHLCQCPLRMFISKELQKWGVALGYGN